MQQKASPRELLLPLLAATLLLCLVSGSPARASLASFVLNRPKLFQRAQFQAQTNQANQVNQVHQQQQLQPQASQNHHQRLVFAANTMLPSYGHFGLSQQQADLLRVPVQQQHLAPDFSQLSSVSFDTQAAGYYKPTIEPLVGLIPGQSAAQVRGAPLEQSQTEIVDKIERHIGRQIDQSLSGEHSAAASGYQHQPEEAKEKESSASQPEEAEELEEPAAEKRHHEEKKAHEEEHHHEHHHEHHPMEAFEVHHKKGGKSFQYFHQGHSS